MLTGGGCHDPRAIRLGGRPDQIDVCDRTRDLHGSFLSEGCDILWEVFRLSLVPVGHDVPTQDPQFPTAGRLKLYGKVAHRVVQVPKTHLLHPTSQQATSLVPS